jgi:DNA-binding NarL/FixJ family response regulator
MSEDFPAQQSAPASSTVDSPEEPPAADGEGQCSARQVLDALAGRLDELARVARKAARLPPGERRRAVTALRQALALESQELAQQEESTRIKKLLDSLTPREREVFFLVAAGMANKNIATCLGVCLQTVKLHRGHVMHKLQLDSIADLVHLAEKAHALLPGLGATT